MNKSTDRIIELLDNALQHTTEQSYGDTTSSDNHCLRDGCDYLTGLDSDFCGPCREYLLGDTDVDPLETRATGDGWFTGRPQIFHEETGRLEGWPPHIYWFDEEPYYLEDQENPPRSTNVTLDIRDINGQEHLTLEWPNGDAEEISCAEVRRNYLETVPSHRDVTAHPNPPVHVSTDLIIHWTEDHWETYPVIGDLSFEISENERGHRRTRYHITIEATPQDLQQTHSRTRRRQP